jgi:hypothetical protein
LVNELMYLHERLKLLPSITSTTSGEIMSCKKENMDHWVNLDSVQYIHTWCFKVYYHLIFIIPYCNECWTLYILFVHIQLMTGNSYL